MPAMPIGSTTCRLRSQASAALVASGFAPSLVVAL